MDSNAAKNYAAHVVALLSDQSKTPLNAEQFETTATLVLNLLEAEEAGQTSYPIDELALDDAVRKVCSTRPLLIAPAQETKKEALYTVRTFEALNGVFSWFREKLIASEKTISSEALAETLRVKPSGHLTLGDEDQRPAILGAAHAPLTLLTGGPGTGKTTVIAACLAEILLRNAELKPEQIVLCAPTGKAAHRMSEGLASYCKNNMDHESSELQERMRAIPPAKTLHRLLGASVFRPMPLTGSVARLSQKVIVVDECSMVGAELMCALLCSLAPDAKLILVGDADQLPSVECGDVFRTMVQELENKKSPCVRRLTKSRRSATAILEGARMALKDGIKAEFDWRPLQVGEELCSTQVRFINGVEATPQASKYTDWLQILLKSILLRFAKDSDWSSLSHGVNAFKIIVPNNEGPAGVHDINERMHALAAAHWHVRKTEFIVGEPVMIVQNIHHLGLSNGDVGIVCGNPRVRDALHSGKNDLHVCFISGSGQKKYVPMDHLVGRVQLAWASTCHKAQGSEYQSVFVVLPESESRVVNNNWLYTAITRAKEHMTIIRSQRTEMT